jgi:nucleoside-diphosphate-sugar epimerase
MNVTIIGCGYVGRAVARVWRQQSLTVSATTPERLPELTAIADRALVLRGDNKIGLRTLLENQQVVLLSVGVPSRAAYEETYLSTAKTLVEVVQNSSVQQIIYTGSYAVYGDYQGDWVTEASALRPANTNGEVLAATEQTLLELAPRLKVCIFRLGGIYGPGRELIKIFAGVAGSTRPGDGSDISNWVHLDDIVGAVEFARAHQLEGVYNLVQDQPITTGKLFEQVFNRHNLPSVRWDASQLSTRPYNARVSNQKLRTAGYRFKHPTIEP